VKHADRSRVVPVDPAAPSRAILRAAAEIGEASLHARVQRWARLFRAR